MHDSAKKILVVDDNAANLAAIAGLLEDLYRVFPVNSGAMALKFFKKQRPDLILLDVEMPEMSGIELIKHIKANKEISDIPVIFLTALSDTQSEAQAFEHGAVDYIHKPVNSIILLSRVKLHLELEAYRLKLEELVRIKTSQVLLLQKITIDTLACVNEFRGKDSGHHVKRTVGFVSALLDNLPNARPYNISKSYYEDIIKSTPLHDIGKISIPDAILLKPGRLTEEEYRVMATHVLSGADILQTAIKEFNGPSFLDVAYEMVLTHHEKWDGTGYPYKLTGERIPISGRLMALADVYDALTSERPYKTPFSHEKAIEIIKEGKGRHFDPLLVDTFVNIQDDIKKIAEQY